MKRFLALMLSVILMVNLIPAAFAAEDPATAAADELNAMGLFSGTGTDASGNPIYELDRAPTRQEAVTMLVRLLGKEAEAKAGNWDIPFTDVAAWARPYVGYAYANGLTNGTSTTTFGSTSLATATQYLTFVLRALGYESGKDFQWNAAWELSDKLGITNGEYNSANNTDFLRGDITLISRDALDVRVKGQNVTLLENIQQNLGVKSYSLADYTTRKLSNAQIKALKNADLDTIRAEISTIGDAVAWLDLFAAREYGNLSSRTISLSAETYFSPLTSLDAVVPLTYTVLTAWCITDDFDGIQYVVSTTDHQGHACVCSALALPAGLGQGSHLLSPSTLSSRIERNNSTKTAFQNKKISSLNRLEQELLLPWSDARHFQILTADASQPRVEFSWNQTSHKVVLTEGNAKIRYDINDHPEILAQMRAEEQAEWFASAKQIRISNYNLPSAIGKTTLDFDAAAALVGQDPTVIAENVKSVADAVQYMIAAHFAHDAPDVYTPWFDYWGYDLPGNYQLLQNYGCCCGGFANLASYLLDGDYEKVGTLRWVGGGNHTISWVYTGGKYYVFDLTLYPGGDYNNRNCPVTVLDRLEDYYDRLPSVYQAAKSEIAIMVAYEVDAGASYPSNWNNPPHFTGLTFPTEAEGKIITIYQKDPRYGVKYEELNTALPGWNAPYDLSDMPGAPLKSSSIEQAPPALPPRETVLTAPAGAVYEVDYSGATPAETGERKLSDGEIAALIDKTPEQAAPYITTLADAYEWVKQAGYYTHGVDINGNGGGILFRIANHRSRKDLSWTEMSTVINILLEGDYEEVGTLLCAVMSTIKNFPFFFYGSFNYVKTDGWYYVTDPICHPQNKGAPFIRTYTLKLNDLSAVPAALTEINGEFFPITIAAYPLYTEENIMATYGGDPLSVSFGEIPGIRYLFRVSGEDAKWYEAKKAQMEADEAAAWQQTAREIDISRYNIPDAIDQRNLTYDEALALVGQDPAVIAENVKSVADVVQYMIAARFAHDAPDVYTPWFDYWGYDLPGDYQVLQNYGCCCGGFANLASYLLEGDYEKVGILRWVGGGNHTISWVYTGGKYYVFDLTLYPGGDYNNRNCPVTVLDRLEDYYDRLPYVYQNAKSEIAIMVAEEGAVGYPSNWNNPPRFTGLTFPTEAEGKIITIYQKDPRYGVNFEDVDVALPGWNAP